jgi:hypothetical protein
MYTMLKRPLSAQARRGRASAAQITGPCIAAPHRLQPLFAPDHTGQCHPSGPDLGETLIVRRLQHGMVQSGVLRLPGGEG